MLPPLLGDGKGSYRVHVLGNAGGSPIGRKVANILHVPFISLDDLYWLPGWVEKDHAEFRKDVAAALDDAEKNGGGWVVDGNYGRHLRGLLEQRRTDTIWLDPPLLLYFPRIVWRSLLRMVWLAPDCSPGCHEGFVHTFFTRESMIYWCLKKHGVVRKREQQALLTNGVEVGGNMRRIGGWGSELAQWYKAVEDLVRAK
ncbi:hypothetical protein HYDPIDRAFT_96270 [Hydnomerulius pinastri MD-312]|uniref:Adenylate kinase n=1 Tax=Hydnomerulius pinastri MD-312 TaxID=994086 RepID=A0A0C9WBZ1_9AGAM|nr:hypothetical protein HYDPIDRAFT_96270 [Hydnomerulius pinastri MD-312]